MTPTTDEHADIAGELKALYSRLIKLAAALIKHERFLSPYPEDNPASRKVLKIAESQNEHLRLWAIETREIADALSAYARTPDPVQVEGTRNDIYLEAIKAVETARDEWEASGRKHWWPQVAQEVIGVLRTRAALPPSPQPSPPAVAQRGCKKCYEQIFHALACGFNLSTHGNNTTSPVLDSERAPEPEPAAPREQELPRRVRLSPLNAQMFALRSNDNLNDSVEYAHLEPIREALEKCEPVSMGNGTVVIRRSDWEVLVDVVNK